MLLRTLGNGRGFVLSSLGQGVTLTSDEIDKYGFPIFLARNSGACGRQEIRNPPCDLPIATPYPFCTFDDEPRLALEIA